MKKTLAILMALGMLAVPVDTADARGGRGLSGGRRGDTGGSKRARDRRQSKDAKVLRARSDRENRDGLLRDAGRDAL